MCSATQLNHSGMAVRNQIPSRVLAAEVQHTFEILPDCPASFSSALQMAHLGTGDVS